MCFKLYFKFQQPEEALWDPENATRISNLYVPLSHPSYISDLFTQHAQKPTHIKFKYTEAGLAKLLLFSTFLRAQSQGKMDFIATELDKYPYTIKKKLQVREQNTLLGYI